MTAPVTVAAVDLGASGGRVMAGRVGAGSLGLHDAYRFPNVPVTISGTLHWDILRLYQETLNGLRRVSGGADLASVGVDSWAVDYGLLDSSGALLGNPVHYRDRRTDRAAEGVLAKVGAAELYATTGIQHLPFNTIFQLAATASTPQARTAATLLLIPDLLAYWLTGRAGAEVTNASTTQLYDVSARAWATPLMRRAGIPPDLFPPLRQPGEVIGGMSPDVAREAGLPGPLPVTAVGSHDTASAVVAVPARGGDFAYISCGTWSLVGMELDRPVLTEASRAANFTNETGVDATIRYLRNVMGLWLLQESQRTWSRADTAAGARGCALDGLLAGAARVPPLRCVVNPDDPVFLAPGDIPARIAAACHAAGQSPPTGRAETVRCILDSLALAHARAVAEVQELSGRHADTVHMVGGGALNPLLCQLTADACGLPVVAGPAEATAIGNILVQARTLRAAPADMAGMRALVRATMPLRRFQPQGSTGPWQHAQLRLGWAAQ
ncbi:MAG TPA: rhamnulokinase family protein [Streptosporangiaceae bacterium]|nr:rhamnulokinase family protein [Streptosporangiaceae bacterium]